MERACDSFVAVAKSYAGVNMLTLLGIYVLKISMYALLVSIDRL